MGVGRKLIFGLRCQWEVKQEDVSWESEEQSGLEMSMGASSAFSWEVTRMDELTQGAMFQELAQDEKNMNKD